MRNYLFFAAITILSSQAMFSAEGDKPAHVAAHYDARIDTWAEGAVMAIDADGGSLTIRGVKRPYATAYAAMLKEIADETSRLNGEARAQRESEIRTKHADALARARASATSDKDSDFTFYLPKEKTAVVYVDETFYYDRDAAAKPVPVQATEYEKQAMLTFKDLRIGDRVTVGYDSGITYNTAHAIVKVRESSADANKPVKASLRTETKESIDDPPSKAIDNAEDSVKAKARLDADTENARQIRRSLVTDDKLSTTAKNVAIVAENGIFTLKGRVESESEKSEVEKKAAAIVGQKYVVSQLEVSK